MKYRFLPFSLQNIFDAPRKNFLRPIGFRQDILHRLSKSRELSQDDIECGDVESQQLDVSQRFGRVDILPQRFDFERRIILQLVLLMHDDGIFHGAEHDLGAKTLVHFQGLQVHTAGGQNVDKSVRNEEHFLALFLRQRDELFGAENDGEELLRERDLRRRVRQAEQLHGANELDSHLQAETDLHFGRQAVDDASERGLDVLGHEVVLELEDFFLEGDRDLEEVENGERLHQAGFTDGVDVGRGEEGDDAADDEAVDDHRKQTHDGVEDAMAVVLGLDVAKSGAGEGVEDHVHGLSVGRGEGNAESGDGADVNCREEGSGAGHDWGEGEEEVDEPTIDVREGAARHDVLEVVEEQETSVSEDEAGPGIRCDHRTKGKNRDEI